MLEFNIPDAYLNKIITIETIDGENDNTNIIRKVHFYQPGKFNINVSYRFRIMDNS